MPDPNLPLFQLFPSLEETAPRRVLTNLPTPVAPFSLPVKGPGALHIKRDDLTATPYGGNKVRKLEFLLADAQRQGARDLLTFGYAGSNHALATAIYGAQAGLHVTSLLLPQPNAQYVRRNLLAGHAAGARLLARRNVPAIALTVALFSAKAVLSGQRRPYIIPAGGSSPVGVLGYVNAAFELADQVNTGLVPLPDRIHESTGFSRDRLHPTHQPSLI